MRAIRLVAGAIVAGAITIAPSAVAGAEGYGTPDHGTVTDTSPAPGQSVDLVLTGFKPNSTVTIVLHSDPVVLGTFTADPRGTVRVTVAIPIGTVSGAHSIVASGVDPAGHPLVRSIPITVPTSASPTTTNPPRAVGGLLPTTGSGIASVVTIGGLLVVLGAATVGGTRRRAPSDPR